MVRPRVRIHLRRFHKTATRELERNMHRVGIFLRKKTKQKISRGNKTGDNPSEPGEPPKVVTGRLRSSIAHEVRVGFFGNVTGYIGTNVKYGRFLELGTEKMEARPYLRPTILENEKDILRILAGGVAA